MEMLPFPSRFRIEKSCEFQYNKKTHRMIIMTVWSAFIDRSDYHQKER